VRSFGDIRFSGLLGKENLDEGHAMSVSFELPHDIERELRTKGVDLNEAAKESYLVDLFRNGAISHAELGKALELDRFETNALLKRHRVVERSISHEDVDADVRSINELLAPPHQ
jgi:predicted HTH domain antitoxin